MKKLLILLASFGCVLPLWAGNSSSRALVVGAAAAAADGKQEYEPTSPCLLANLPPEIAVPIILDARVADMRARECFRKEHFEILSENTWGARMAGDLVSRKKRSRLFKQTILSVENTRGKESATNSALGFGIPEQDKSYFEDFVIKGTSLYIIKKGMYVPFGRQVETLSVFKATGPNISNVSSSAKVIFDCLQNKVKFKRIISFDVSRDDRSLFLVGEKADGLYLFGRRKGEDRSVQCFEQFLSGDLAGVVNLEILEEFNLIAFTNDDAVCFYDPEKRKFVSRSEVNAHCLSNKLDPVGMYFKNKGVCKSLALSLLDQADPGRAITDVRIPLCQTGYEDSPLAFERSFPDEEVIDGKIPLCQTGY